MKREKELRKIYTANHWWKLQLIPRCVYIYMYTNNSGTPSSTKKKEKRKGEEKKRAGHDPVVLAPPAGPEDWHKNFRLLSLLRVRTAQPEYNIQTHIQCVYIYILYIRKEGEEKYTTSFMTERSDIFIKAFFFYIIMYYYIVALDNSACPPLCPDRQWRVGESEHRIQWEIRNIFF